MTKSAGTFFGMVLFVIVINAGPMLWRWLREAVGECVLEWSLLVLCVASDVLILSGVTFQNRFLVLLVGLFGTLGWIVLFGAVGQLVEWGLTRGKN